MALPLPSSLTPSKVASFKDCALAFRLSAIDRLPEPPSAPAMKGTLVHRVLERLIWEFPSGQRTAELARELLTGEYSRLDDDNEWVELGLNAADSASFVEDAAVLVDNYFSLEDPNTVSAIGTELLLETTLGGTVLRGIIDRLDVRPDGDLVVIDYKTGRAPGEKFESNKLGGVHFYAYLCEQVLGKRPVEVRLMHLREPLSISTIPSPQSIRATASKAGAIWSAVERACQQEDFRPNPSFACSWCSFKQYCPAQGGQLPEAPVKVEISA